MPNPLDLPSLVLIECGGDCKYILSFMGKVVLESKDRTRIIIIRYSQPHD